MLPLRCAVAADARPALPRGQWRWAVDYGPMPDPAIARTVDLLVVEPDHAGATPVTRGSGPLLLAYLSLGEVAASRPYAARLRADGLLGRRNPHWPEASYIDLRDPRWRRMVLERIIPPLVARGFDGIFFDTLDNAEAMEAADPAGAAGMVAAAAALVKAIRQRFPRLLLMMNRGYAMLPTVAPHIDLLLGEAMASRWNFATKRYEKLSDADWTWQADRLRAARDVNPALALLTLDYWSMDDPATVRALYARERAAGFVPYVSMLALDRLYAEPE
ncbi:endo alpha-1,4 polygalactosaminidase [Sphingomonas solaris]|uniref:Endo alpha-1,4 polygalactosaminidase n=2 Tax=Alterirhizorhabdus solaris TaxID=2529389 RepID=A0A558QWA3_9SPHN|nr:endo alpha-1,4 polygalactosaminidase [Sphingomonas solaris]